MGVKMGIGMGIGMGIESMYRSDIRRRVLVVVYYSSSFDGEDAMTSSKLRPVI